MLADLANPVAIGHDAYREAVGRLVWVLRRPATSDEVRAGVEQLRNLPDAQLEKVVAVSPRTPLALMRGVADRLGGVTAKELHQRLDGYGYEFVAGQLAVLGHLDLATRAPDTRENGHAKAFLYFPARAVAELVAALDDPVSSNEPTVRRLLAQARARLSNERSLTGKQGARDFEDVVRGALAALDRSTDNR